jgi:hypothetical protein
MHTVVHPIKSSIDLIIGRPREANFLWVKFLEAADGTAVLFSARLYGLYRFCAGGRRPIGLPGLG